MKFTIHCEEKLLLGAKKLAEVMGVDVGEGGIPVVAVSCDKPSLHVTFNGKSAEIVYQRQCEFNRAFGLLVQNLKEGKTSFDVTETPAFDMNGIMFDMSQGGAAFNLPTFFRLLDRLALMGLNMAMLYVEDNYEVKEYPYFGYMRQRYSQAELKAIDDYAFSLGIEMIPCIQTLAHLSDALRWNVYGNVKDYCDCLLVGSDDTYKFVETLIRNAIAPFRTKKIHVGMDEAMYLGKFRYRDQCGIASKQELMTEHLRRVNEILEKYQLEPMMWNDMFFNAYRDNDFRMTPIPVPDSVKAMVPPNMRCVYWDYDDTVSDASVENQLELDPKTIFAGGEWSYLGYGIAYDYTVRAAVEALTVCKRHGIRDVFVTTWGDCQAETLQTVNLLGAQAFAEVGYRDEWDEADFKRRFEFCSGMKPDDLRLLQWLDKTPAYPEDANPGMPSDSKVLLWQDVMTGLFDKNYEGYPIREHYEKLAASLHETVRRNGEYNNVFRLSAKAADVLALKADLGLRLRAAYLAEDRERLTAIAEEELPELLRRVEALREEHREAWFEIYQPFGWDVLDLRYGGLRNRLTSAKWEIENYLHGKTDSLPELERERLLYNGSDRSTVLMINYATVASPSRINFCSGVL